MQTIFAAEHLSSRSTKAEKAVHELGVGGIAVAWTVLRMRGVAAVPVRDPYLEDSLRYQPQ